jgi:hypothetical protein
VDDRLSLFTAVKTFMGKALGCYVTAAYFVYFRQKKLIQTLKLSIEVEQQHGSPFLQV